MAQIKNEDAYTDQRDIQDSWIATVIIKRCTDQEKDQRYDQCPRCARQSVNHLERFYFFALGMGVGAILVFIMVLSEH